jgi:signal transduction histidine kinase
MPQGRRGPEPSALPPSTAPLTPPSAPGNKARSESSPAGADPERALLRHLVDAVADPLLFTSAEGEILMANARARELLVAGEGDSEGHRRAVELNQQLFHTALLSSATGGASPVRRRDLSLVDPVEGMDLLFELDCTLVQEPGSSPGRVCVLRNVTDLGRATRALGESYRRLRASEQEARSERLRLDLVLDSVADPIILTDPAGATVLMNDPAERLFAAPHDSGEASRRRAHTNDAQLSSFLSHLLSPGGARRWRGELSLVDPSTGAPLPMEGVASQVLSDKGEPTSIVTLLHDRTEAREKARLLERLVTASTELEAKVHTATAELAEQNEKLRRQALQLEQASAAKSQFLANMSHEFRTPLNAILGYTNMLLQGVNGEMTTHQRRNLQRIDSNGRHLLQVINEILDITRIEAGRMPLNESEFKIPELFQEVIAEMDPIIARTKLAVSTALAPELPELHSDRQKVKQIVLNLLSNALKFTHKGSVQVSAAYELATSTVTLSVKDTGIGIAPEHLEKIFEDFQQVDNSPTRPYGGTGLGLSICRRLAAMMGGRVTVQSTLEQGSTFTLHLPRRMRRP